MDEIKLCFSPNTASQENLKIPVNLLKSETKNSINNP